jgi:ribosomal protein S18 acetylase RimI-like enzyme
VSSRDVAVRSLRPEDAPACDAIVASLPYHFGDEGGRAMCARAVRTSPGFVADADGEVVGFVTWKRWYGSSVEVTWMAVHATRRRQGIGGRLIEELAGSVAGEARFLVVTTLSEATPEPDEPDSYAGTRAFYRSHGFEPMWEPAGWWNDRNQAVLMVRVLDSMRA